MKFTRQTIPTVSGVKEEQKIEVAAQESRKVTVSVRVDAECLLFCDEEFTEYELPARQIIKVDLPEGEHLLTFHDKEDLDICSELEVSIPQKKFFMVNGLKKIFDQKRQEGRMQQQAESIETFKEAIGAFLNEEDKILEPFELEQLEQIRQELELDEATAKELIKAAITKLRQQPQTISAAAAGNVLDVDAMREVIVKNELPTIKSHLRKWQTAEPSLKTDNPQYEAIESLYYMVFAALDPDKLIQEKENDFVDKYWRTYWTVMAYMKSNRKELAEDLLLSLRQFSQYDEYNISLLEVAVALNESGIQSALSLYKSKKADDYYSSELNMFAKALQMEMGVIKPTKFIMQECAFVLDNLIYFGDEDAREERKAQLEMQRKRLEHEEEERNRRYYYLKLTITSSALFTASEKECAVSKSELYKIAQSKSLPKLAAHMDFANMSAKIDEIAILISRKAIKKEQDFNSAVIGWSDDAKDVRLNVPSIAPQTKGYSAILTKGAHSWYYELPVDPEHFDLKKLKVKFDPEADDDADEVFYDNKALAEIKINEDEPQVQIAELYLNNKQVTAETIAAELEKEAEQKRIVEQQAKLRKQITYTIKITAVSNQLQAMMTARSVFGWGTAEFREQTASLPIKLSSTTNEREAKDLYNKLKTGGFVVQISAVNGLNEIVKI